MTFVNKLLAYLGFCPSKEAAQDFRVRNNTITLKQKEYRKAIIRGIGAGLGFTIGLYLIRGEVTWAYIIPYSIVYAFAHLISVNLRMRREAKKEEMVQRRE